MKLWAPAGTSGAIVQELNIAVRDILKTSDSQERFAALGAEVVDMDTKQFAAFEQKQIAKWAKIVREANIRVD